MTLSPLIPLFPLTLEGPETGSEWSEGVKGER